MKNVILSVVLIISACPLIFSQENQKQNKHFERVTAYPDGKQTSLGGTIIGPITTPNGVKTERYLFANSYDEVWDAAKQATQKFSKIGKRPLKTDEEMRRISNSNIEKARNEKDTLIQTSWIDEVMTEVTYIDKTHSRVIVSRKVLEIKTDSNGKRYWANVMSNGKIERWILTQIEDEINKGAFVPDQKDNSNNNDARKNEKFIIQTNGFTFNLNQCKWSGGTVMCHFTVTSNDLDRDIEKLWSPGGSYRPRLVDNSGNEYGVKSITFANKQNKANLVADVPTQMIVISEDFNSSASEIALLQLYFKTKGSGFGVALRKIPIVFNSR